MTPSDLRLQMLVAAPTMAAIVCMAAVDQRTGAVLRTPIPHWLGRVSFSLYLVHIPILLALQRLFSGREAPMWSALIGLPASLMAAEVLFRLAERPAIELSRKLK